MSETRLIALGQILQSLQQENNGEVLITTLIDYLHREFPQQIIWLGLYDRLEHRLIGKGGITPDGEQKLLKQRFFLNPGDLLEQVVIQQIPLKIKDLCGEVRAGEWRRIAQQFGIHSTMLFPLSSKGRCFGVILMGSTSWDIVLAETEQTELSIISGTFACALYQMEIEWQYSATKHADEPLFEVFAQLEQQTALTERLESIVNLTQQFINPTRTNVYWYSPEKRYFWHRLSNRQLAGSLRGSRNVSPGITVAEAYDFYQTLAEGKLVAIGAGRSSLKPESTERLLTKLKARSLLAAPIRVDNELLGFLAVEDEEAHIWEQVEQNYVGAATRLISLVTGNEDIQARLEQVQADNNVLLEISQTLATVEDPQAALDRCAYLLCQSLQAEQVWVVGTNPNVRPEQGGYRLVYQYPYVQQVSFPFADWEQEFTEVVAVEDIDRDPRFGDWYNSLKQTGVRSLLICPISNPIATGIVMLAHSTPRTWQRYQIQLVSLVAQNLGWLLATRKLSHDIEHLYSQVRTLETGLQQLRQAPWQPYKLEQCWLEYIADLLTSPCALFLSWDHQNTQNLTNPQELQAQIAATMVDKSKFTFNSDLSLPVHREPLIQAVLNTKDFFHCNVSQLDPLTLQWLNYPNLEQVLVIPVRVTKQSDFPLPILGVFIFCFSAGTNFPRQILGAVNILMQQFAWLRHQYYVNVNLLRQRSEQQILNWYKHRCLEILNQSIAAAVKFGQLKQGKKASPPVINNPTPTIEYMRQQQLLRQLENTLTTINPVLNEEKWRLTKHLTFVSVAHVIKRSLILVDSLYQQRQLRTVIRDPHNLYLYTDSFKLKCILLELLMDFYHRVSPQSTIKFFCHQLAHDDSYIELLILENDTSVHISNEKPQQSFSLPPDLPTLPLSLSNISLQMCQRFLQILSGKLSLHQLEDNRYVTRLLLPVKLP